MPPRVEVRGGGRQVEDDAAHRGDDVGPQFEQPVPQPGHLGASTGGPRRAQPEFLHQHIGRGGEEDAQLIRPEATAAGPTDLEPVVQLFDPILDVTAGTVERWTPKFGQLAKVESSPRKRSLECHGRDGVIPLS